MAKMQRVLAHDLVTRVGHWVHLLNLILLVLSGLQIHFITLNIFGSMNNARLVHFVDMYVFFFLGVFHVYHYFASGKWRLTGPTPRNLRGTWGTVKYYLFLQPHKPPYREYNPLQIISYFLLFALSAFMALVGFALYWPQELGFVVRGLGGLMTVRQIHYLLMWVFIAFTIVHVYLVATQPFKQTKSMVTGSYWRRAT